MTGLTEWVLQIVERLGYIGVLVLVALENLIPPIPSEVVLPLAGVAVGQGKLNFIGVMIASTAGSLIGAVILYAIGRRVGERRLREFGKRHRWVPFASEDDLDRAHDWFERHGGSTVFFGRLIPFIRSGISLPAGFTGMPLLRFTLYTTAGSAIWNGLLIGAGWWLGARWEVARQYTSYVEYVVIGILVIVVARALWQRWQKRDEGLPSEA
jgi:membrane protein DedA with SNARE-associated domain